MIPDALFLFLFATQTQIEMPITVNGKTGQDSKTCGQKRPCRTIRKVSVRYVFEVRA
jgi:hypothetical protein